MGRRLAYGLSMACCMAATALTLASIILPEWLVWSQEIPTTTRPRHTYGLHKRCTTVASADNPSAKPRIVCHDFPRYSDCHSTSPSLSSSFCPLWRTASYLLSLTLIVQLVTLFSLLIPFLGGVQQRAQGWKPSAVLLGIVMCSAGIGTAIVGGAVLRGEERFQEGWSLGRAWWLCMGGIIIEAVVMVGMLWLGFFSADEGGYELIEDQPGYGRIFGRSRSVSWASSSRSRQR